MYLIIIFMTLYATHNYVQITTMQKEIVSPLIVENVTYEAAALEMV